MSEFFEGVAPIRYEGLQSDNPFANNVEPAHSSGRQELLEGLVARRIDSAR